MTFSRVRTFILALVVGVVVALALGFGFESIQAAVFPPPPGASAGSPASSAAARAATPLVAELLLLAEWTVTDLVAVAAAILANDGRRGIAWAAWIYPLLATVANYSEHPYPDWLTIAGAAASPLAALAAYRLAPWASNVVSRAAAGPARAAARWQPSPVAINAVWLGVLAPILLAIWFVWLPRDDQTAALISKGLILLVGGYVGLMNAASLLGAGVGWIADPTTARDDSPQPGGERLFHVLRWREAVMALGSAGLVAFFVWLSSHANPMFVIGTVAFGFWAFVFGMQALFPSHLRLMSTGFEAKHWSVPLERVAWTDIAPLYVQGDNRIGFVCYRYLEGRRPAHPHWAGRLYRTVGVCDGRVPSGFALAPGPLCDLMNEMRGRRGGIPSDTEAGRASGGVHN